jgi:hypothetical protein
MPAVLTTNTLSAWRARRLSWPDRSLALRHAASGQEKGRLRTARLTPARLATSLLSIRLSGECIAEIEPDFTPLPGIRHAAFIFAEGTPGSRGSGLSSLLGRVCVRELGPSWERAYASQEGRSAGTELAPVGGRIEPCLRKARRGLAESLRGGNPVESG